MGYVASLVDYFCELLFIVTTVGNKPLLHSVSFTIVHFFVFYSDGIIRFPQRLSNDLFFFISFCLL